MDTSRYLTGGPLLIILAARCKLRSMLRPCVSAETDTCQTNEGSEDSQYKALARVCGFMGTTVVADSLTNSMASSQICIV